MRELIFERTLAAPANTVFRALTSANGLQEWLCDVARTQPQKNGAFYVAWNREGYFAGGCFRELVSAERISFTWHGWNEPAPTLVTIDLQAADEQTRLTLTHSGLGEGEVWAQVRRNFQRGWDAGLENLASVLERGEDLRLLRQPLLGVIPVAELDEALAEHLGVPVSDGIQLGGTVPDTGAEAAGLRADDVLVAVNGHPMTEFGDFAPAIAGKRAGDTVQVAFFRGAERHVVAVELANRPTPAAPPAPGELANTLRRQCETLDVELADLLAGAPEPTLEASPATGEWSANAVVAHLINAERDMQNWIALEILDGVGAAYTNNEHHRVLATASAFASSTALLDGWRSACRETLALISSLPDDLVARRASYQRIAQRVLFTGYHVRMHLDQIRANLASAHAASEEDGSA
jgi:uncharacterized protein YndB with AHSA1/START domain